jgi:hypothetical protein
MADLAFVLVIIGFFALCAAFVVGCDRIVRADRDDGHTVVTPELVDTPEVAA